MSSRIVINNKTKKVQVFKAMGMPNLRILPGHNLTSAKKRDELEPYFATAVGRAMFDENCEFVMSGQENMQEAAAAKMKNDELNKASALVTKANQKVLSVEKAKTELDRRLAKSEAGAKQAQEESEKELAKKDSEIADKDSELSAKNLEISALKRELKNKETK
jgi:uncharacterized protein (DUF3084 family)